MLSIASSTKHYETRILNYRNSRSHVVVVQELANKQLQEEGYRCNSSLTSTAYVCRSKFATITELKDFPNYWNKQAGVNKQAS